MNLHGPEQHEKRHFHVITYIQYISPTSIDHVISAYLRFFAKNCHHLPFSMVLVSFSALQQSRVAVYVHDLNSAVVVAYVCCDYE